MAVSKLKLRLVALLPVVAIARTELYYYALRRRLETHQLGQKISSCLVSVCCCDFEAQAVCTVWCVFRDPACDLKIVFGYF